MCMYMCGLTELDGLTVLQKDHQRNERTTSAAVCYQGRACMRACVRACVCGGGGGLGGGGGGGAGGGGGWGGVGG